MRARVAAQLPLHEDALIRTGTSGRFSGPGAGAGAPSQCPHPSGPHHHHQNSRDLPRSRGRPTKPPASERATVLVVAKGDLPGAVMSVALSRPAFVDTSVEQCQLRILETGPNNQGVAVALTWSHPRPWKSTAQRKQSNCSRVRRGLGRGRWLSRMICCAGGNPVRGGWYHRFSTNSWRREAGCDDPSQK